jgi:hypothetical protein
MLERGSTECRFTGTGPNGYPTGICCVKHKNVGCTNDADCCDSNDVCYHEKCIDHANANGASSLTLSGPIPVAARLPVIKNDEYEHDLKETKSSNPDYGFWVPLITIAGIFGVTLLVICCLMYYLFHRRYVQHTKQFEASINEGFDDLECDQSDNTEFEDSSNDIHHHSDSAQQQFLSDC